MTGERDPRAHWLDDDPFDKQTSPRSHTKARDDGNWRQPHIRVVHATPGSGAPFARIFGFEEQARPIPIHTGSIWHFSKTEINHLAQATLAFSIALAFMSVGGIMGALNSPLGFIIGGIVYVIAIAPAFLVHETAHKVVARKYGCWAEFRASPSGLRYGVILAALTGIVLMAPGAVMVAGNTTRSQFGKVALAGPVSNVALWVLGLGVILLGGAESLIGELILVPWLWGNAILGLFNMLPFGPLDGKKIRTWSIPVFWIWMIICASLVWFNLTHLPGLL
ncbi:MAG: M50 family metallopeptidase [Candidatus Thalassarchaeum sp.]